MYIEGEREQDKYKLGVWAPYSVSGSGQTFYQVWALDKLLTRFGLWTNFQTVLGPGQTFNQVWAMDKLLNSFGLWTNFKPGLGSGQTFKQFWALYKL